VVDRCPEECAGKFTAGARRIGAQASSSNLLTLDDIGNLDRFLRMLKPMLCSVSSRRESSVASGNNPRAIEVIDTIIRTEPSPRLTSGTLAWPGVLPANGFLRRGGPRGVARMATRGRAPGLPGHAKVDRWLRHRGVGAPAKP
jgi:hypothetical protein